MAFEDVSVDEGLRSRSQLISLSIHHHHHQNKKTLLRFSTLSFQHAPLLLQFPESRSGGSFLVSRRNLLIAMMMRQSTMTSRPAATVLAVLVALMMTMMAASPSEAFVIMTPSTTRVASASIASASPSFSLFRRSAETASTSSGANSSSSGGGDPNEIVARRIILEGDVQGGYYRSCVLNEAGRFRRLTGTMSPPDDSKVAEIYVEGKRKMVDGFLKWCNKSDVGLSQVVKVTEITEADPTGLYDSFYCKTR